MSEQMSEQGETLTEALANLNDKNIKDAALPDNKKVVEEVQEESTFIIKQLAIRLKDDFEGLTICVAALIDRELIKTYIENMCREEQTNP